MIVCASYVASLLCKNAMHFSWFLGSEVSLAACPLVQVEQLTEQLRQHGAGAPPGLLQRLTEARVGGAGPPGSDPEQRDLRLELDELRTAFTEQVREEQGGRNKKHKQQSRRPG